MLQHHETIPYETIYHFRKAMKAAQNEAWSPLEQDRSMSVWVVSVEKVGVFRLVGYPFWASRTVRQVELKPRVFETRVSRSWGRPTTCDPHALCGAQYGAQRRPDLKHIKTRKNKVYDDIKEGSRRNMKAAPRPFVVKLIYPSAKKREDPEELTLRALETKGRVPS